MSAGTTSIDPLEDRAPRAQHEMPGRGSSRGRVPGKSSATARASAVGAARRWRGNEGGSTVVVLRVTIAGESMPRGTVASQTRLTGLSGSIRLLPSVVRATSGLGQKEADPISDRLSHACEVS